LIFHRKILLQTPAFDEDEVTKFHSKSYSLFSPDKIIVHVNAKTPSKSRRKSAEQMFLELLEQYQVPHYAYPLIELQLKKLFDHFNLNLSCCETKLNNSK